MPFFFLHYFALGIVLFYALKEEKIKEVIMGCVVFVFGSLIMNETLTHTACAMLFLIMIIMVKNRYTVSPALVLVIAVGCTFVGAVVVRNLVERPMEKLGNRILQLKNNIDE